MLYLVGGASRAGKSKLARRLLLERQLPYLSLDILLMGLANGVPSFGHNPNESTILRGEQMWPLVRAMAVNVVETHVDYVIEGDILLPHHLGEFTQAYGTEVRACFLGYTDILLEQKLYDIRNKGGEANDWLQEAPDVYVRDIIERNIVFSIYLRKACAHHELHYFDTSDGFDKALDAAFSYLIARS
jgi:hypothetical protein